MVEFLFPSLEHEKIRIVQMAIKLTEEAAAQAKTYIEDSKEKYLRVSVKGGGCAGFEYNLTVGHEYDEQKDSLYHQHGVDVVVDKKSDLYLDGTILDYYNDITKQGFAFENPNAVKSCGCGSSFQA